jgi:hypothetical protein
VDALASLFARIPTGLFGPLTGSHAPLHWAILSTYYHYEFEREPFFLLRGVVVDTAEELIRESPIWTERRQELLGPSEPDTSAEFTEGDSEAPCCARPPADGESRLEGAGWFHFEYRRRSARS